jgi:chloramphenicol 3-O phosphotransferase
MDALLNILPASVGKQLLQGMRRAVRAMAETGLNLVVDDVLMSRGDPGFEEYRRLSSPFSFGVVGVPASLETLERREKERGDRMEGLARWQFSRVHAGVTARQ